MRVAALLIAVILLSVAWVLGWEYFAPEMPAGPPDWRGKVVAVCPAGGEPGWVLIALDPADKPADPDRAAFKEVRADFTTSTPVRRRTGKDRPANLQVGQTVSVWCDGPFTDRAPPARPAGFIVIEK
jgi:hypothetical protein